MARRIPTLIALLLACVAASAQQQQAGPQTVSVDFRVFGVGKDSYQGLYYFDGNDYTPLQFHRASRSLKHYHYKGSDTLRIFVRNPAAPGKDGLAPPYLPIASVHIPPGIREGFLLFAADGNNRKKTDPERRFQIVCIDDGKVHFPANSIVVINTTPVALHGRVADERLLLQPGASPPIPYHPQTRGGIPIMFALKTANGLRLALSNEIPLPANRRIVLILESPRREGSTRLETRILSESLIPKPSSK